MIAAYRPSSDTDQTTELVFRAHPHGWRVGIFLSGTYALSFRFSFVNSTSIGSSPTFSRPPRPRLDSAQLLIREVRAQP
jgi:hypothetical protein